MERLPNQKSNEVPGDLTPEAAEELRKTIAALTNQEAVEPGVKEANTVPERMDEEAERAVAHRSHIEENLAAATQSDEVIKKKLPGYDLLAKLVRDDVARENENIINLDEKRNQER